MVVDISGGLMFALQLYIMKEMSGKCVRQNDES